MAQLIKERSRKPLIDVGHSYPSTKTVESELHYALEVSEPWQPGGKHASYTAILSKSEAMTVMSEWLKTMAQQDRAERKRLEKAA